MMIIAGICLTIIWVLILMITFILSEELKSHKFDPNDPSRYGAQVWVAPGAENIKGTSVDPNDIGDDD